jgi:PIN domain nuclease of toxin-antitoxin system
MIVLDTSAVLALLFDEPGADEVKSVLASAILSAINYAEVLGRYERDGKDSRSIATRIAGDTREIVAFDASMAYDAAHLMRITRPFGLSLGDRCCLALAMQRKCPVLTADRIWLRLSLPTPLEIRSIR